VLRTISALSLAGLFIAVVANLDPDLDREGRRHVINEGSVFLIPLALMVPATWWFFAQSPEQAGGLVFGGAVAMSLFFAFGVVASTLIGLYAYFGLLRNKRYVNLETALLLAGIALVATGAMEYVREGIRKPYVIYDFMYANGLTRAQIERFDRAGFFAVQPVVAHDVDLDQTTPEERGQIIFDVQCLRCHAVDGYNAVRPLVDSWSVQMIRDNTRELHRLKPFMPPFGGTEEDLEDLVAYLASLRTGQWEDVISPDPVEATR